LNAALDRVNELIAAGLAEAVTREDLATLQRLQEEFAAELATLRGRVDALEARTAELEANQFSTTTKLRGETIFNVAGVADEPEGIDSQITFGYRVRLNFDTSFTGEDRLRTRFQVRNIQNFDSDPVGFSFSGDSEGDFELDDLAYTFPLGERVEIAIAANGYDVDDFVASTISPLDSSGQGSISNFGFPSQYNITAGSGAGVGAIIQLTDNLSLDGGYLAGRCWSVQRSLQRNWSVDLVV
jgi:opacity protein-like surface antigen